MHAETKTLFGPGADDILEVRKYRLRVPRAGRGVDDRLVDKRLIYVGSSPECDIVVDHPTVSRTHCKIEVDRTGHRVRDLQSKNGVFVNGVRVVEAYLPREALLRLGGADLSFELAEDSVEVALSKAGHFGGLIGESLEMREIFALLARIAPTDATVLVEGESGTGKELVAEAVHHHSRRRGGPLVVFDCSAVPAELIESELFGHIKGAFTGATTDRQGAFQEANGGTLFIDEIGELALDLQPKLLRALEKREVKPVGSNRRFQCDARIVAATNRDLAKEVENGNFREDLFYRLAVIRVSLPPLRKRQDDIPVLVHHFLRQLGGTPSSISFDTMAKLQTYPWPGNVRELRNFIERALLLSDTGAIETRHARPYSVPSAPQDAKAGDEPSPLPISYELPFKDAKNRLVDAFERHYWLKLLHDCGGNISEAARRGGIHRKSLEYLIRKLDIHPRAGDD
jgi:DNA-binding NtrC family response regulator